VKFCRVQKLERASSGTRISVTFAERVSVLKETRVFVFQQLTEAVTSRIFLPSTDEQVTLSMIPRTLTDGGDLMPEHIGSRNCGVWNFDIRVFASNVIQRIEVAGHGLRDSYKLVRLQTETIKNFMTYTSKFSKPDASRGACPVRRRLCRAELALF